MSANSRVNTDTPILQHTPGKLQTAIDKEELGTHEGGTKGTNNHRKRQRDEVLKLKNKKPD